MISRPELVEESVVAAALTSSRAASSMSFRYCSCTAFGSCAPARKPPAAIVSASASER
ncbi:hypothetical protein I3W98_06790 [Streptomyces cavourensis]|nr:hypothetical protein [Streptomyces cavourensis]